MRDFVVIIIAIACLNTCNNTYEIKNLLEDSQNKLCDKELDALIEKTTKQGD